MNRVLFLSRIEKTSTCWIWRGAVTAGGYGLFGVDRAKRYAHRLSYEMFVGPIPSGLQIDHRCRVRLCVNPDHLEAVTQRENLARGRGKAAIALRTNHCKHGHDLTKPENVWRVRGGKYRACAVCNRAYMRARRAARKASA